MEDLVRIRQAIECADMVLVGASNGLDISEGLNIFADDAHFRHCYGDLAALCGARSILDGMWRSQCDIAASWAWRARFAKTEWLDYEPSRLMLALERMTAGKDRFVVTCNTDGRFVKAGFAEEFVLETEGSVRELVCRSCGRRSSSSDAVLALEQSISNGRVNEGLVPCCPRCGAPATIGVDEGLSQNPDKVYVERFAALRDMVDRHRKGRLCVLELGVGLRNGLVKRILASAAAQVANSTYAVFNYNQVVRPRGFACEFLAVEGDMAAAFAQMENTDVS